MRRRRHSLRRRYGHARGRAGSLREFAESRGLYIATWSPGDGITRYRFFTKPSDYHEGGELYTALGRKEADLFIRAYGLGRSGR